MQWRSYGTIGCPSVRVCVCPIDRQRRRPAGLLLSAGVCSRYRWYAYSRRSAVNAGSVMLRADGRGSTQTCLSAICFHHTSLSCLLHVSVSPMWTLRQVAYTPTYQRCRGDGISIPIPIPYPLKILCVSPQDPHTHRTPKSYIPIPAPCLFTTRGQF